MARADGALGLADAVVLVSGQSWRPEPHGSGENPPALELFYPLHTHDSVNRVRCP